MSVDPGFQKTTSLSDDTGLGALILKKKKTAGVKIAALTTGLIISSAAVAGDIIPPKSYTTTPGGINIADGSFVYSVTDLSIGTLKLERFHRTGYPNYQPNNAPFGVNLSHNFDIYVAANPQPLVGGNYNLPIVHIGASASGVYKQSKSTFASIQANNVDAQSANLTWSGNDSWTGGNYIYTDQAGNVHTFSRTVDAGLLKPGDSQRVTQIAFADGRLRTFSYNSSKQLKLVEDSSGYAIVFDYNGSGDISAACGFNRASTYVSVSSTCTGAPIKTTYGYTSGYLTSAVDVNNQTTTYSNSGPGIACIKPPGFTSCTITNTYLGARVSSQALLGGGTWGVSGWDPTELNDSEKPAPYDGHNEAGVTDPAGKGTSLTFTKTSPSSITDPLGRITRFQYEGAVQFTYVGTYYHDGSLLREATLPEGNKYQAEYNAPYNAISKQALIDKSGPGASDQVQIYGYGSCVTSPGTRQNCAKPIWVQDAKGNRTNYSYASHGGVLSEMKPAPTSGAARPLKLTSWVQKYAYVKNSGGSLVPAASAIWMLSSETECQTAAGGNTPVCDGAAPQRMTTYEYGADGTANNLNVRGVVVSADGQSRRTCYSYDDFGNRISQTTPRAGLTSCP